MSGFLIRNFGNDRACESVAELASSIGQYAGKSVSIIDRREALSSITFVDVSTDGKVTQSYGDRRPIDIEREFGHAQ